MKILRVLSVLIMTLAFAACSSSGSDSSSAVLESGEVISASDIEIGEIGAASDDSVLISFPKALSVSSVTGSSFFAVLGSASASMAKASVAKAWDASICDASKALSAVIVCSADKLRCRLEFGADVDLSQPIVICLSPDILFEDGSSFEGEMASLTAAPDTKAPDVDSFSPALNATGFDGSANIVITFSEKLDSASVSAADFALKPVGEKVVKDVAAFLPDIAMFGDPMPGEAAPLGFSVSLDATAKVVTLDPTEDLGMLSTYVLKVNADKANDPIRDAAGNAMGLLRYSSFSTGAPELAVSTNALSANCIAGQSCSLGSITISNAGVGSFDWTISCVSDPETICSAITIDPSSGSIAIDSDAVAVSATAGKAGTYTAALTVDAGEAAGSEEIALTIVVAAAPPPPGGNTLPGNHAPVATAQSVDATQNGAAKIYLNGSDADDDTLSYIIVSGPSHGGLYDSKEGIKSYPHTLSAGAMAAGNRVDYAPDSGFTGADSFVFKVNDGAADSSNATVSITVTEADPSLSVWPTDITITCSPGPSCDSHNFVISNDGGGTLTWSVTRGCFADDNGGGAKGAGICATLTGENSPLQLSLESGSAGSGVGIGVDVTFDASMLSDGIFYAHLSVLNVDTGSGTIVYVTIDATNVTPGNAAPIAVDDSAYEVNTGETLIVGAPGILSNDTDANGDSLSAILVSSPDETSGLLSEFVSTGAFRFIAPDVPTTATFTYKVNDGTEDSNEATVTITVTEEAPSGSATMDPTNLGSTVISRSSPVLGGPWAVTVDNPGGDNISIHNSFCTDSGGWNSCWDLLILCRDEEGVTCNSNTYDPLPLGNAAGLTFWAHLNPLLTTPEHILLYPDPSYTTGFALYDGGMSPVQLGSLTINFAE